MNRIELYHKTVDVLYQAYFNDTLKHGDCKACAVGNICIEASEKTGINNKAWGAIFMTRTDGQTTAFEEGMVATHLGSRYEAFKLIEATGYTPQELAKVEYAFESAPKGKTNEDWMFNGLVAVLEVLKDIHGVTAFNFLTLIPKKLIRWINCRVISSTTTKRK